MSYLKKIKNFTHLNVLTQNNSEKTRVLVRNIAEKFLMLKVFPNL